MVTIQPAGVMSRHWCWQSTVGSCDRDFLLSSPQDEDFSPDSSDPPAQRLPGQPQPQGETESEVQDQDGKSRDGKTESK